MSICSVNTQTGSKDLHSIRLLSSLTPSSWWLTVHAADGPTKKTHCTFHISYDSELIQPVWEVNSRTSSHKSSHRRAHRGNTADDWSRFLSLRTGVVSTHDEVCEVVLLIAVSMHFFFAVNWECVVVVLRVSHLWPWNEGGCNICVCECVCVCVCVCVSPVRANGPSQLEHVKRLPRLSFRTDGKKNKQQELQKSQLWVWLKFSVFTRVSRLD